MRDINIPLREQTEVQVLESMYRKKLADLGKPTPVVVIPDAKWLRSQIAALDKVPKTSVKPAIRRVA